MRLPIFMLSIVVLSKGIVPLSLAREEERDTAPPLVSGPPVDTPTDSPRGCRRKKYMMR